MTTARRRLLALHAALAALVVVPLLLTHRGMVGADTKTYLYLDPGRLLERAPYLWDRHIGLGTITHQTIGYLFPMGPYYWVMERLGLPDWVAQRLWLASLLVAAGAGVVFLLRTLGWRVERNDHAAGLVVAACAYAFTPYVLAYAARISAILLPWAGLPWLVALAIRSLRAGGWRWPAVFALVVLLVGGMNATALVLAGIGPVLWFPYAVFVRREATVLQAVAAMARIGVLTLVTSLWWIAGLMMQGRYGIPILRYTETYETVARLSNAPELLRGLGYWFFYGTDKLGPWIEASVPYTQNLGLIAVGFALPCLAFVAAGALRWGHRLYFALLVAVGTVVAVGAHPWGHPSPFGALFKAFTRTDAGLALRSTPRAAPLLVLGLAVLLGAGARALVARWPGPMRLAPVALVALILVNLAPLFTGDMVGDNLERDEELPSYWTDAAAYLDGRDHGTRVLEIPGTDFASYRWGNTVDPITPGLMDRPYAARELIPYGSPAAAELMIALDRRMQEGIFEPQSLAPLARLLGVGDIAFRADLQYERYRTPRPRALWQDLNEAPGLSDPVAFGAGIENRAGPQLPMLDEIELGLPAGAEHPPAVAVFGVEDALPIARAVPAANPIVVAGDADSLVDLAAAGLLDPERLVLYAASLTSAEDGGARLQQVLDDGAELVLTDGNRRRGLRWSTVRDNAGFTERAGQEPLETDLSDNRLDVHPDATDDARTVVEQRGVARVDATAYANPVSFTPEDRPANALDGDPLTAWRVGGFDEVVGERWEVELEGETTVGEITLLQPIAGPRDRFITRARLRFDGRDALDVDLDPVASRQLPGQVIDLGGTRTFTTLSIEVLADNVGERPRYTGVSAVGLAEVGIGDARVTEVVRVPVDLQRAAPDAFADRPVSVVLTRLRSDPAEAVRGDEEVSMRRAVELPAVRPFALRGTARLSARAPEEIRDDLIGRSADGVVARSGGHLSGDRRASASAAIDSDPTTAWETPFGFVAGDWVEYDLPAPVTFDRLALQVFADGRHSVPTELAISTDGGEPVVVTVPDVPDDPSREDAVASVDVALPVPVTGTQLRIELGAVREVTTIDFFSEAPITMPVGIAEWGIDGLQVAPAGATFDSGCRDDLVTIDGTAVPVRVRGAMEDALDGDGLELVPCRGSALELGGGTVEITTAAGRDIGIDVDRLVLTTVDAPPTPVGGAVAPVATVEDEGPVSLDVRVEEASAPYWLVLGQSHNDGWEATIAGQDAGAPLLVNGFANGWRVEPRDEAVEATLRFTPQRLVWWAIAASVVGVLMCVGLVLWARQRGREWAVSTDDDPVLTVPPSPGRAHPLAVVAALVTGAVFGGVVVGVVAALAVVATHWAWPRVAVWLAPGILLGGAGAFTLAKQWRYGLPTGFEWPTYFDRVHVLGLCAVAVALADAAVSARRAGASRPPGS